MIIGKSLKLATAVFLLMNADGNAETLSYRGFTVDMGASPSPTTVKRMKEQLDIVADCGAGKETEDFFRTVRMVTDPRVKPDAEYQRIKDIIVMNGTGVGSYDPRKRPFILHELMHAFEFDRMKDNSKIVLFYNRAVAARLYYTRGRPSYALTNDREFFAVTASMYLAGFNNHEPSNRAKLKRLQPQYYAYLGTLFGVTKQP